MLKKVLFIFLVFSLVANTVILAEDGQFRFPNWPLEGFENRTILTSFSDSHFGVDVAASEGEDVKAAADGKVYWTYSGGTNGISVGVEHLNGWRTTYLHLSERLVKKGQEIKAGELIGRVGKTGTGRDAEEAHLHFALIVNPKAGINEADKRYADPLLYAPLAVTSDPPSEEEELLPKPQEQPAPEIPLEPAAQIPQEAPVALPQPALLSLPVLPPIQIPKEVRIIKKQVNQTGSQPVNKAAVYKLSSAVKKKVSAESINEAKIIFAGFLQQVRVKGEIKSKKTLIPKQALTARNQPVGYKNKGFFLYWLALIAVVGVCCEAEGPGSELDLLSAQ